MEKRVVITGGAGGSGKLLAVRLLAEGWEVHCVDKKRGSWPEGITGHQLDVRKRGFDDVLRRVHPWAVVHLARLHRLDASSEERHRVNFEGTVHVFEMAVAAGVEKIVFPSRHTIYGALPDQPLFLTEDHPPAAGRTYPEIQDLVAADLYATAQLWRHMGREVVVLRPVNLVGPNMDNLFCRYLRQPRVFTVAGFDPLYQVLHEADFTAALALSLAPGLRGVFNVAGHEPVPLHVVVEHAGGVRFPLPEPLIELVGGRLGFPRVPRGAVDYLKFACTVDGSHFQQTTGFSPIKTLTETLDSMAPSATTA
ncbi:MAG: NAD-dependent epimerase/dehydratase family protein [Polyangiaceae bacterium]